MWRPNQTALVVILSKVVSLDFYLLGNVYIPVHDLFSDIPVSCKHGGCSFETKQKQRKIIIIKIIIIIMEQEYTRTKHKTEFH